LARQSGRGVRVSRRTRRYPTARIAWPKLPNPPRTLVSVRVICPVRPAPGSLRASEALRLLA